MLEFVWRYVSTDTPYWRRQFYLYTFLFVYSSLTVLTISHGIEKNIVKLLLMFLNHHLPNTQTSTWQLPSQASCKAIVSHTYTGALNRKDINES